MTPQQKLHLAITASMEGQQVTLANIGERVTVSQMELVCLVTFAEIGVMSIFSNLEGETADMAAADLERTLDAVRKEFGKPNGQDGLNRLMQSTVALLRSEKFQRYLPNSEPDGGGP